MNINKSSEFFNPDNLEDEIHIIGVGSVGATIAENLARLGVKHMYLYDFDTVESHNVGNQIFLNKHIGKSKVESLAEILLEINPAINLTIEDKGWDESLGLSGHIFLAVDSVDTRRKIIESNAGNITIKAFYDVRTRLLEGQHYAASGDDDASINNLLRSMDFTDEEANEATPVSACGTTLSVAYTIRAIVGLVVANFVNKVLNGTLNRYVVLNLEDGFTLTSFKE